MLVECGIVDAKRCCVVVDKALNLDILTEIQERHSKKFKVVCAAEIYDELFRQVRIWARMGE